MQEKGRKKRKEMKESKRYDALVYIFFYLLEIHWPQKVNIATQTNAAVKYYAHSFFFFFLNSSFSTIKRGD